jgi:ABC-type glycerol-3-phosphate transport system substrate-binding protein
VTGVDGSLPFEFGIRNALVDLSTLDGFEEIVSNVAQGSRIPYYFSGAEYSIAETINLNILYYRTDVLDRLDIDVPDTWKDVTNALSTLLQNNYAMYYPYGDYLTFFFQNDVDVYTDDALHLAFTNEKGMAAYKQWVDLYVKYGLQPTMSSFYQHFRVGDVPLGIAGLDQYIQFDLAATDISGDWSVTVIPGTVDENGVVKRWQAGTQTGVVMFKTTSEREQKAWDFLCWWLDTDTQYMYAEYLENYYGEEFRWFSANPKVVSQQEWPENVKQVILTQLSWYKQLPMVPGGSYMTSRELWNAWTRIVIDNGNYREEIEQAIEDIELEIEIKQQELGYIDADGNPLIEMSLMRMDEPDREALR